MNELALFAGAGGGILGGQLLGWRTVCAVESQSYPASVLAQRQNDGLLETFPIWDDVRTFDGKPWRGIIDVVSGGFPCQDISAAGKGAGINGERSGLWSEMARIIGEVRPRFAFVENSPMLTIRGLHRVLGDMAEMGLHARWGVIPACAVGAPHKRERIWIVGYARSQRWNQEWENNCGDDWTKPCANGEHTRKMANTHSKGLQKWYELESTGTTKTRKHQGRESIRRNATQDANKWETEPDVGRVADGVAARVDRLKAIGNGQVPQCAAEAWRILTLDLSAI